MSFLLYLFANFFLQPGILLCQIGYDIPAEHENLYRLIGNLSASHISKAFCIFLIYLVFYLLVVFSSAFSREEKDFNLDFDRINLIPVQYLSIAMLIINLMLTNIFGWRMGYDGNMVGL